ncbi:MAG: site-specific DNA-methyltransferase [Microthrixaceae bacterium]|nr:site-specific DNA-methyltransferase [Microthrixaceae bacterium]
MAAVCSWCGLPDPAWLMSLEPLGTALKPAHEPIILARKPLRVDGRKATVAKNVLTHGTGAINIDATRVDGGSRPLREWDYKEADNNAYVGRMDGSLAGSSRAVGETTQGRWPANVILDPEAGGVLDEQTGTLTSGKPAGGDGPHLAKASVGVGGGAALEGSADGSLRSEGVEYHLYGDSGGASRFFYCAKTAKSERNAGLPEGMRNDHPTVKPVALMEWLVRMVTPPGGTVLDPFCGSGTTMVAAERLGFDGIGIDRDDDDKYLAIARHRVRHASELEYEAGQSPPPAPSPVPTDDSGVLDLFPDL